MAEYSEFIDRNMAYTVSELRNLFCSAYLLGYMTKESFWAAIREHDLDGPREALLHAYATGVLALAAEAQNAAPEPPTPVSGAIRPEPSELVRVTATARQMRGAA